MSRFFLMLSNIRKVEDRIKKWCYCNDDMKVTNMIVDLTDFGVVYYNPHTLVNVLPLSKVVKVRRIVYDSKNDYVFIVIDGNSGPIHFV